MMVTPFFKLSEEDGSSTSKKIGLVGVGGLGGAALGGIAGHVAGNRAVDRLVGSGADLVEKSTRRNYGAFDLAKYDNDFLCERHPFEDSDGRMRRTTRFERDARRVTSGCHPLAGYTREEVIDALKAASSGARKKLRHAGMLGGGLVGLGAAYDAYNNGSDALPGLAAGAAGLGAGAALGGVAADRSLASGYRKLRGQAKELRRKFDREAAAEYAKAEAKIDAAERAWKDALCNGTKAERDAAMEANSKAGKEHISLSNELSEKALRNGEDLGKIEQRLMNMRIERPVRKALFRGAGGLAGLGAAYGGCKLLTRNREE